MGATQTKHSPRWTDLGGVEVVSAWPPVEATSTAAHAGAAAAPARQGDDETSARNSPAQRCFSEGLHSVFAFLDLREFAIVSRCCRSWSATSAVQPPLRLPRLESPGTLEAIAHSYLARHIERLILSCFPREISSVLSLCCRLPHLTTLALSLTVIDDGEFDSDSETESSELRTNEEPTSIQMPHTLRKLELELFSPRFRRVDWSQIDPLIARLCNSHTPPLTSLRVAIDAAGRDVELPTQIPLETLGRLLFLRDSLSELILAYQNPCFVGEGWDGGRHRQPARWTQAHIDVFRRLTQLQKLDPFGGRWSDEELLMLCAEPAPAHLRILPLSAPPATAAGGEALERLPLDEFDFRYFRQGAARNPKISPSLVVC